MIKTKKIFRLAMCSLFATLTLSLSSPAFALDAIVYMISGGPFDTGGSETDMYGQFLQKVQNLAPGYSLSLKRNHNSKQSDICADIVQQKKADPTAKVIIAGHSYGADAGIWVAKCLLHKSIFVDFLLTMDTVPRNVFTTKSSLTVPENVLLNYHFYQQQDAFLKGAGYNRRADGSARSIYNTKQNFGSTPIESHLAVLRSLNDYAVGPLLAAGMIENFSEARLAFELQPYLERFFKIYPPLPISSKSGAKR